MDTDSDKAKAYLLVQKIHEDPNFDQLPSELQNKLLEIENLLSQKEDPISLADLVSIFHLILLLSDLIKPG